MRYHYKKPNNYEKVYGVKYLCEHPFYDYCTLYLEPVSIKRPRGLAVVQEYWTVNKMRYYANVEPWLANDIYMSPKFQGYFNKHADLPKDGLYPTVTVRQIMWALRMKPLPKTFWEKGIEKWALDPKK